MKMRTDEWMNEQQALVCFDENRSKRRDIGMGSKYSNAECAIEILSVRQLNVNLAVNTTTCTPKEKNNVKTI